MELQKLEHKLTVCKLAKAADMDWTKPFYFVGKTDEEFSLVCPTAEVPENTQEREDGWRGFRICGVRDEVRLRNEKEQKEALLSQEVFLLRMMEEMERGEEKDWLSEAAAHGLNGYASVRWDEQYGGIYLETHQGFLNTAGFLVIREPVSRVYDPSSTRIEVYDRGEEIIVYRLSYYWD